jgi:hypothetical protein
MFQFFMMQRARFWEEVLQRLSMASEPEVKGAPNGADERG